MLENLVEAAYSRDETAALAAANRKLEVARHLWRLAHELAGVSTRRYADVMKLDVRSYFPSVDHELLRARLSRRVKDARVLALARLIVATRTPVHEPARAWPPP